MNIFNVLSLTTFLAVLPLNISGASWFGPKLKVTDQMTFEHPELSVNGNLFIEYTKAIEKFFDSTMLLVADYKNKVSQRLSEPQKKLMKNSISALISKYNNIIERNTTLSTFIDYKDCNDYYAIEFNQFFDKYLKLEHALEDKKVDDATTHKLLMYIPREGNFLYQYLSDQINRNVPFIKNSLPVTITSADLAKMPLPEVNAKILSLCDWAGKGDFVGHSEYMNAMRELRSLFTNELAKAGYDAWAAKNNNFFKNYILNDPALYKRLLMNRLNKSDAAIKEYYVKELSLIDNNDPRAIAKLYIRSLADLLGGAVGGLREIEASL